MKKLLFTIWLLLVPSIGLSQEIAKTPTSETQDVILFLEKVPEQERPYLVFFSFYNAPPDIIEDAALCLSFVVHSLTGISDDPNYNAGSFYPIAKVEDDKFKPIQKITDTIYYVDIRQHNWELQDWQDVAVLDPTFIKPAVEVRIYDQLRLMAGNNIVNGLWFIANSMDVNRQLDNGQQLEIYNKLLYSKSKIPQTIDEFRRIWGIDIERSEKLGNESGAVVIDSNLVSRVGTRVLRGHRSEIGYLYQTYDTKSEIASKDFLETFPFNAFPKNINAGEAISTNTLGLQVYFLFNGEGKTVPFGDPSVVRNNTDFLGDARVRVPNSCLICHSEGLIPARNIVYEYKDYLNLQTPTYEDKLRLERIFQNDRFNESILDNQKLFARALLKTNGLSPQHNYEVFHNSVWFYSQPLDLEQVLIECGTDEKTLREKIAKSFMVFGVDKVPARLKLIIHPDPNKRIDIPRDIWEYSDSKIPSLYTQTMAILHGITTIATEYTANPVPIDDENVELEVQIEDKEEKIVATHTIEIKSGAKTIAHYNIGDTIIFTGNKSFLNGITWLETSFSLDGETVLGYINKDDL